MPEFSLYWTREDHQGSLAMGTYATRTDAEAAIPDAKRELLDQCGEEYQRTEILAGVWSITEA